ncbi:hypothetical protein F5B19DRAFT_491455 [Rostrohypoxylon terebratum]|nr:hypothetical protein F5B19DRAFT_491455 [Rostrohypoxylon terebratum]
MPQETVQQPAHAPTSNPNPTTTTTVTDPHCASHSRRPWGERPKLRWAFLIGLVVLVVAVLITGVVFTVYYDAMYYSSGAFLLHHDETENTMVPRDDVFMVGVARDDLTCGSDTGGGCEAYGHPNICCPVGMTCKKSSFSPSGVFCCWPSSKCVASPELPPLCSSHTTACNRTIGGGCCLHNMDCAKAGCIKTYLAAPGFKTTKATTLMTTAAPAPSGTTTQGGVVVTTVKMAELAQSDAAVAGVKPGFGYTSCPELEVCA